MQDDHLSHVNIAKETYLHGLTFISLKQFLQQLQQGWQLKSPAAIISYSFSASSQMHKASTCAMPSRTCSWCGRHFLSAFKEEGLGPALQP